MKRIRFVTKDYTKPSCRMSYHDSVKCDSRDERGISTYKMMVRVSQAEQASVVTVFLVRNAGATAFFDF